MPRKSKLSRSCAEKALKMHALRSKKRQIEEASESVDCYETECNIPPKRLCQDQDQCHQQSLENTKESTRSEKPQSPKHIKETESDQLDSIIKGRRIISIGHFFNQLKNIANHGPMNCGLDCVEIIGERQIGFLSKFTLKCKLCNMKFNIETDAPDNLHVNHAAVAGVIAIGCGHWQLQELSAALNLPLMTAKTYQKSHAKLTKDIKKISIDSMSEAAKKEREMAIAEGRVNKNGIPIIDVIVDGCWCKRTYKKNYSALSGAAAIIGKRTGEVLFLCVRNKYCAICAQAEKKEMEPKTHVCYKNYNGPSTGMESDILLEGFKCSIDMHNLIYGRMVSDGDSSTYAKLLKSRPYDNITVEKIECRNHVLRNLCNKLVQLQTNTTYLLKYRKQLTQTKIMVLRRTIRKIIQHYKSDSESQRRCNIEPLYNDLLLAHPHTFGDHSRCKASFCTVMNKSDGNPETVDKQFFTSTLWSRICLIMSNVASNAPSLIHDVDSNLVERFNSIVAKLAGGKRTNLSLRGSYQTRCQAAIVSFNSHKMMSRLYKSIQGHSPRCKIKLLEERRMRKLERMRKNYRKKNRRLFYKGNDANYGEKCAKPDLDPEMFEKSKTTFLQNLQRSEEERKQIEKDTVLQSTSSEWMEIRRTILTASNFGRVIKRRANISCANLVKDILYKDSLSHVTSIKHGRENEQKAIEQLKMQENIDIKPCGLFIDRDTPFLGASPDGVVVGKDMIVEIKCPVAAFKDGINEAIKSGKLQIYKIGKNGALQINKNHNWYYQIQGQLHITNKSKCVLGIWYGENNPLKTEYISRDDNFWNDKMKNKLTKFYLDCLLPELVDPRHSRNMPIRDPLYIENAIKEKQNKDEAKKTKVAPKKKVTKKKKL
ncbi:hypothetical protein evm_002507 [Chilo suppressalis]|nr:hypothetical protein evm_002507 [Chilo suppressalis]